MPQGAVLIAPGEILLYNIPDRKIFPRRGTREAVCLDELERLPIPLLQWYHENARVLPWRSDPTPYHVLVSEVMLQQTRVAAVLDYYRRFLEALPTVADLAAVEEDRL